MFCIFLEKNAILALCLSNYQTLFFSSFAYLLLPFLLLLSNLALLLS